MLFIVYLFILCALCGKDYYRKKEK